MNEQIDSDKIVNRHMARTLTDLEEAGCPAVFVQAVRSAMAWMRSDLKKKELTGDQENAVESKGRNNSNC